MSALPPTQERVDHSTHGRPWTVFAFLMPLTYLVWFWLMFALGYWITDYFGAYPSGDLPLSRTGLDGLLAAAAFGLLCGLPSWIGAWMATHARRLGAGAAAVVALVLNLVIALAFLVMAFG